MQEHRLPVKVVIFNNQSLGMVRQWQETFYDERYSESLIASQPDFIKLAEAYGIKGYRANTYEEAERVFKEAFEVEGPAVIDCRVLALENVYPMVAPGKGLADMIGVNGE